MVQETTVIRTTNLLDRRRLRSRRYGSRTRRGFLDWSREAGNADKVGTSLLFTTLAKPLWPLRASRKLRVRRRQSNLAAGRNKAHAFAFGHSVPAFKAWARDQVHQHVLETTVDNDLLPIHEAGTITRQEQHYLCHILRCADAPYRNGGSSPLRYAGSIGPAEIARRLSISRASVYRIIGAQTAV
jgi:hypothetical protein